MTHFADSTRSTMKKKKKMFLVSNLMNCKENNEKVILGLCFRINSTHLVLVVFAGIFFLSFAYIVYTDKKLNKPKKDTNYGCMTNFEGKD